MDDIEKILKEEIGGILDDIISAYNTSGRKVTGDFAKGLSAVYTPLSATIYGYEYLAGRGPTKKSGKPGEPTLRARILQWMEDNGMAAKIRAKQKTEKAKINAPRGVAYAIARKIHREGTDKSKWLNIYQNIITPERIDRIIDRVGQLNVNKLLTEITAELQLLTKY